MNIVFSYFSYVAEYRILDSSYNAYLWRNLFFSEFTNYGKLCKTKAQKDQLSLFKL